MKIFAIRLAKKHWLAMNNTSGTPAKGWTPLTKVAKEAEAKKFLSHGEATTFAEGHRLEDFDIIEIKPTANAA